MVFPTEDQQKLPVIFLAKDDDDDIYLFRQALSETAVRHSLFTFQNGDILLQALTQMCPRTPDLIFPDINMLLKNGFEALQQIRETHSGHLPVFLLSTAQNEKYVENARRLGATGYLSKPVTMDSYSRILSTILSKDWKTPGEKDFYIRLERAYVYSKSSY